MVQDRDDESGRRSKNFETGSVQCDFESFIRLSDSIVGDRNLKTLARFTAAEGQRAGCGSVILSGRRCAIHRCVINGQITRAAALAKNSYVRRPRSSIKRIEFTLNCAFPVALVTSPAENSDVFPVRIGSSCGYNSTRSQRHWESYVDSCGAIAVSGYGRRVEELCALAVS